MRRMNQIYAAEVLTFLLPCMEGYSRKIPASFKLDVSLTVPQTASPQSIRLDNLIQVPEFMIALAEKKDGKNLPIAAQTEKKEIRFLYGMVITGHEKKPVYGSAVIGKNASGNHYENAGGNFSKNDGQVNKKRQK